LRFAQYLCASLSGCIPPASSRAGWTQSDASMRAAATTMDAIRRVHGSSDINGVARALLTPAYSVPPCPWPGIRVPLLFPPYPNRVPHLARRVDNAGRFEHSIHTSHENAPKGQDKGKIQENGNRRGRYLEQWTAATMASGRPSLLPSPARKTARGRDVQPAAGSE
jgi:hypothetical protein